MITVRRATQDDASKVFDAERAYIDCPWTLDQIRDETERDNAIFLIAECDGAFAGYASCEIAVDCCDVNNIAVEEKFRRMGVARRLLAAMEAEAKKSGATEAVLTVREDNAPALALYKAFGYAAVHTRRGYYKDKNGIVMTKKF